MLRYSWRDDFMTWYPEMHGGIEQIVVRAEDVWTPDIFLANSEADDFDSKYRTNILITYKGDALWVPPGLQKSSCGVEMEFFPFDTQICTLRYGSWMYSENFINLQHAYPSQGSTNYNRLVLELSGSVRAAGGAWIPDSSNDLIGDGQTADMTTSKNTIESKEFELLSKEGVLTVVKYDCCPDAFQGRSPDKFYLPKRHQVAISGDLKRNKFQDGAQTTSILSGNDTCYSMRDHCCAVMSDIFDAA